MAISNWFQEAFEKFGEISLPQYIMFFTLLVIGIGLLLLSRKKVVWTTKMLTFAALSIALSFVLGMIRLFKMPQGGSITPASMLPLMVFSYAFGTVPGIFAGAVYGILDFLQSSAPITNVWSFMLDYIVGFGVIGLTGLFNNLKNQRTGLLAGIVLACAARFTASVFSGVMFYATYAEGTGLSPLAYSIGYNGSYMLPEMVICGFVALLIGKQLIAIMKKS